MDIKNPSCEYTELNAQKKENETLPKKLGFQLKLRSVFLGMFFGIFVQLSTIGADSLVTPVTKQGNANQMPYSPLISYGILSIPGIIVVCMVGFIQSIFNILVHSTFMSTSQQKALEALLCIIKINFAFGIILGLTLIPAGIFLLINTKLDVTVPFIMMGPLVSLLAILIDWTGIQQKLLEAMAQEDIDLTGKGTTPKSPQTMPLTSSYNYCLFSVLHIFLGRLKMKSWA